MKRLLKLSLGSATEYSWGYHYVFIFGLAMLTFGLGRNEKYLHYAVEYALLVVKASIILRFFSEIFKP